jgi:tRNA(Ile)-lysidine synthase
VRDLTDLAFAAFEVLNRRLLNHHPRPVAVALSGGGDSVALLRLAAQWASAHGRTLLALTVDHGLNPDSAAWTQTCAEHAARAGAAFRALCWEGPKPATGLPAAARAARHGLLAQAARKAGARVILIGHTADDVAEARTMRATGSSTPEPAEWSPSPAWPEGRGLFIARPLLSLRRAALRDWLGAQDEAWIDDPANADPRFARARARLAPVAVEPPPLVASVADLAARVSGDADAGFTLSRQAGATPRLLSMVLLCAGGGERPPERERQRRAAARIGGGEAFTAALAGARIEAARDVRIFREAGEVRRSEPEPLILAPGEACVWDGRYEIESRDGGEVRMLAGLAARLPEAQRRRLAAYPPAARKALPALVANGEVSCPLLTDIAGVTLRPLARARLLAAAGVVTREPD